MAASSPMEVMPIQASRPSAGSRSREAGADAGADPGADAGADPGAASDASRAGCPSESEPESSSELDAAPRASRSRRASFRLRFASFFAFFASFFAFFASLRKSLSTSSFATILIPESMAPDARRALAAREGEEDAGVRFRRCRTKSCWLRTESQPSGQRANDG